MLCSYKLKFEEGAEIKPQIPLLNNRIYDNKFESQFYMISDTNKVSGICSHCIFLFPNSFLLKNVGPF